MSPENKQLKTPEGSKKKRKCVLRVSYKKKFKTEVSLLF